MKEIIVKKTHEITAEEWQEITLGFNEEFKRNKTSSELVRFYNSNFKGYSYHGLAKDEQGTLTGFTSINPSQYSDGDGNLFFAGLSGSTFVRKDFRNDIFVFHDIYKKLREACAADGCKVILGVPNKNSFRYVVKLLGFKFLYNLPYYVLPVRIGKIFKHTMVKFVSPLIFCFVWVYVKLMGLLSLVLDPTEKKPRFNIFFSDETYLLRFNDAYTTISNGAWQFTYRVYDEKNIRTAYLFEFKRNGRRCLSALYKAMNHILKNEKIDVISFIGRLDMQQPLLLKLPQQKEPQPLPLTVDILVPETDSSYAGYSDSKNWNFGLANFDVR